MSKETFGRPIFLLGNARSGSTLFYHLCAGHPDVAWFSNFTVRFKRLPQLARLSPLFPRRQLHDLPRVIEIFIPKPAEGQPLYAQCNTSGNNYFDANDATPSRAECVRELVSQHLKYHRRPRFLNKNIKSWRQIAYLDKIFPDAKFVHIVRDPRANTASYLNWWLRPNYKEIWREGKFPAKDWETQVKPLIMSRAKLWIEANKTIAEAQTFLKDRYYRIYYEELTADRLTVMSQVLDHCELRWMDGYRDFIQRSPVRNMNDKYRKQFTEREYSLIEELTTPLVDKLGYAYF